MSDIDIDTDIYLTAIGLAPILKIQRSENTVSENGFVSIHK